MKKNNIGLRILIGSKKRGKEIIGEADDKEKEDICLKVEELIANITTLPREEIRMRLRSDLRILFSENFRHTNVAGFCNGNNIIINKDTIVPALKNDTNKGKRFLKTIIHELIHKMQQLPYRYEGVKILGFFEGATELMARRVAQYRPKSMSWGNYRCNVALESYTIPVAIMAQIEVLFGKKLFELFTLEGDTVILKHMTQIYGWKFFEKLATNLNSTIRGRKRVEKCIEMQDELMHVFCNREFHDIKNVEDAERFLTKLRELDKVRMHKSGDETLRIYYEEMLKLLKQRFSELDDEKYAYKEVEFYPQIYLDEEIEHLDSYTLYNLSVKNPDDFKKLDLSKYRRYRIINGQSVYEVMTYKGKPTHFTSYDENCHSNRINLADIKRMEEIQNSKLNIKIVEGKVLLSAGRPLIKETVFEQVMEEVPLGVTERKIYNRMKNMYYSDKKSKNKLPPFEQLMKERHETPGFPKWWELKVDHLPNNGENGGNAVPKRESPDRDAE